MGGYGKPQPPAGNAAVASDKLEIVGASISESPTPCVIHCVPRPPRTDAKKLVA
jgi:hypothetical protein